MATRYNDWHINLFQHSAEFLKSHLYQVIDLQSNINFILQWLRELGPHFAFWVIMQFLFLY